MALEAWLQQTPLHEAASSGDVDKVRELLEGGKCDVNCVDWHGCTPLHMAADRGHLGVASVLMSQFITNIDAHNRHGETPLHLAIETGHLDMVKALVSKFKADVNACTNTGITAFEMAVNSNNEQLALVLMNEFQCDTKGGTPYIHTACKRGWVNLVRALVQKHGTGILKNDCMYTSAFDMAVDNNREEVAVVLMNEFHCDTKWGTPYIHTACKRGWVNLVRALVHKHGTGILKNGYGYTAFDVAVDHNQEELALVLMNEFQCDTKGGTPYIHTACERGWVNLVRALLQKHGTGILNPNAALLHDTRWREMAVMLLEKFGLSVQDSKGQSLLHIVCEEGDISLVRTLIKDGKADVTLRDNEGKTPFDIAFDNRHEKLALVLMNEFHCDTKGGAPYIHIACLRCWVNLVRALVHKHGTGILKPNVVLLRDITVKRWREV